jgi:hypothetical protein
MDRIGRALEHTNHAVALTLLDWPDPAAASDRTAENLVVPNNRRPHPNRLLLP